jgi:iron complex outermembrane receptor protein
MIMNQKKLFQLKNLVTTAAIALVASSVNAQTIDYGAFEELFGEPVTTSATGSPQRMSEVPLNMEIITQKDIKRTGAKTIPDVLRGYSGISVTQFTETDSEVGFRGYNVGYNDRVLVLVNGRQVFMDYYGLVAWETIPVELAEIRQIEVVKGPNTALFGFNAVSGVINILTYNPMYDDINSIEITGGTHKYRQGSAVKTIQGDKYGIRVSVGSYHMDKFNSKNTATGIGTSRQENSNKVSGSIDAI